MSQQSTPSPCEKLFGPSGWLLKKDLIPTSLIDDVCKFVIERKTLLNSRFEEWSGSKITDSLSYARHQARIPEYKEKGLPKDLHHYLRGEFDLETRLDARVVNLLATDSCKEFLCGFMGVEEYLVHYPPMLRFKMPDSPGSVIPSHQDAPFSAHLSDFFTVWVPLVDIDHEVGGVTIYEESQKAGVLNHESSGPWEHGVDSEKLKYNAVTPELNRGDALMFPSLLIHESAPQMSRERLRYSIDFRVIHKPEHTTKSYFNPFTNSFKRVID